MKQLIVKSKLRNQFPLVNIQILLKILMKNGITGRRRMAVEEALKEKARLVMISLLTYG